MGSDVEGPGGFYAVALEAAYNPVKVGIHRRQKKGFFGEERINSVPY